MEPHLTEQDELKIQELKDFYRDTFKKLSRNDERTIEFYFKQGIARGVDGFEYVNEAIKRASMKRELHKPISYVASLCKGFYRRGLFAQPSQEEDDIFYYMEQVIGPVQLEHQKPILTAISVHGAVRVMAATCHTLLNPAVENKPHTTIIDDIIKKVGDLFGPSPNLNN